jgi:hypothetical protein
MNIMFDSYGWVQLQLGSFKFCGQKQAQRFVTTVLTAGQIYKKF